MIDFSFLAIPNIAGMRFIRYVKILAILLMFGVCLFFVVYFFLQYRKKKALVKQLDALDSQTLDLQKQLLIQKIIQSSDKTKLVLFIEYLEKFVTTKSYTWIRELLSLHGFSHQEIRECERVLYADQKLSPKLCDKMIKAMR